MPSTRKTKLRMPPIRKAEFRDIGRGIARSILERRKEGASQDAGGRIAAALERAYKRGLEDAPAVAQGHIGPVPDDDHDAFLDLAFLPENARRSFLELCVLVYGADRDRGVPEHVHAEVRLYEDMGPYDTVPQWRLDAPSKGGDAPRRIWSASRRKTGPLMKRGLLGRAGDQLRLTPKALASWANWLANPDNDPQIEQLERLTKPSWY